MNGKRSRYYAEPSGWHLQKGVPISLIFALFVQFGLGVFWVSGVQSDLAKVKNDIAELKLDLKEKAVLINEIATIKTEMRHLFASFERMERLLDRFEPPKRQTWAPAVTPRLAAPAKP